MTNIPTELLRTLVAVVDLRSFTKAAQSLGVTQPAVSAQIKRLQGLLGTDLLDKSAPGVSLTSAGELVVNYARRLLSINDQILDLSGPRPSAQTLRIGAAGDFAPPTSRWPRPGFTSATAGLAFLGAKRVDGRSAARIARRPSRYRGLGVRHRAVAGGPPLLDRGTGLDACRRRCASSPRGRCRSSPTAKTARSRAARSRRSTRPAARARSCSWAPASPRSALPWLRVSASPRCRAAAPAFPASSIWEDAPLPKLPEIFCGIYVRAGCESERRDKLADALAQALRSRSTATNGSGNRLPDAMRRQTS